MTAMCAHFHGGLVLIPIGLWVLACRWWATR